MEPAARRPLVILLAITVLAAALRFYRLDAEGAWFDESFSISHAARPLGQLFDVVINDFAHPPLHHLALHFWFAVAGVGAWEARLISVILGTLSIPLLYLIARRFTDPATSLCAAFLLAISQIAVYFSQEARGYMQTQFFSLAAALSFLALLEKPNFACSTLFALCGLATIYSHYYGAGTLLALGIYWLIFRRSYSPGRGTRLTVIALVIAAAYTPWLLAIGGYFRPRTAPLPRIRHAAEERVNLVSPVQALNRFNSSKFGSIDAGTPLVQTLPGFTIFTLPALAAIVWIRRASPSGVVLGTLMAALPLGLAIGAGLFGMVFNYRHHSFAAPGYYLVVALGARVLFSHTWARWLWFAAVTTLCAFALHANYTISTKPDYRAGFAPMAQHFQPGDCVANRPRRFGRRPNPAWEVYYRNHTPRLVALDELTRWPTGCSRLWVAWDRTWWMNRNTKAKAEDEALVEGLRSRFVSVNRYDHPAIELELFTPGPR